MNPIYIFRIVHIENLEHILRTGLILCPNHHSTHPNYRSIGNNQIISSRNQKQIPGLEPLAFRDFVAFYFGPRSIMLYNIHTGYGEVPQIDQQEIIYLVYNVSQIREHGYTFFFTDGHAMQYPITKFFFDLKDLDQVNFKDAYANDFSASQEHQNPGLKRRKQAEFHIKKQIDFNHIAGIVVYNEEKAQFVLNLLKAYNYQTKVKVHKNFYF